MQVMSHTSKWYTDTAGSRPGRSLPYFGQEVVRMCEMPSANMHANARGLAKLASIMANKGQTLMSEETWSVMHANSKTAMDAELSKWLSIFPIQYTSSLKRRVSVHDVKLLSFRS